MRIKRIGKIPVNATNLYVFAWTTAQLLILLRSSEIQLTTGGAHFLSVFYSLVWFTTCGLLLYKAILKDKYTYNAIALSSAMLVLVYVVSRASLGSTLILYGIFMLSLKDVDLRKLLLADMKVRLFVLISLFLLSTTGVINNYSDSINGNLKYAFGWSHPNSFTFQILVILIESIYLYLKRVKIRTIVALSIIISVLMKICANRTAIISFIVFLVMYLFAERGAIKHHKILKTILTLITPICGALSWLLVYLYASGNDLARQMNSILTERLRLSVEFLGIYPFTLWGTKIETVSTRQALLYGIQTHIFDMSYIRLPLEYGIVFFTTFIILFIILQILLIKKELYKEATITAFFSLVGIASNSLLNPFSNVSFLFVSLIAKDRKQNSSTIKDTVSGGGCLNV